MKTLLIRKSFEGDIHVALTSDEFSGINKNTNISKEEKHRLRHLFFLQFEHLYETIECSWYSDISSENLVELKTLL